MAELRYPNWYTYVFWLVYIALAINFFFIQQKYKCVAYLIYVFLFLIMNIVGLYNNLIIWRHLTRVEKALGAIGSLVFFVVMVLFMKLFISSCIK